jgi:hypothetical protein
LDVIQAVEICSRDSRFFIDGRKPSWLRKQGIAIRAEFSKTAIPDFIAYLTDYATGPEVWDKGGKRAKCQWIISTVSGLAHWLHMPLEQAWEMPPGAANWLLAAAIEQSPHGSIDIISEAEKRVMEKLKEGGADE